MVTTDTPLVEVEESNGLVVASLNRPEKYNALNPELVEGLETLLESLHEEPSDGILFRGNGPATCAGVDTDIVSDPDYDPDQSGFQESLRNVFDLLRTYRRPTALAGHGAVVGGGVNLALCCDFTVFGEETTVQYPEIQFGIVSQETMHLMASYVGDRIAKEIVITGEAIPPERAVDVGLANAVAPEATVEERAREMLEPALEHDPELVQTAKRTLDYQDSDTFWSIEDSDLELSD